MVFTLKFVRKLGRKIDDSISARSALVWGALGLFVLAIGIGIGWIAFPITLNKLLPNKINLAYGEDTRRHWMHMPVFDFNIYLFNVTNHEAVRQGEKPTLQEIGPYCYKEFREKVDLREDPTTDTLSYRPRITWVQSQGGPSCAAPHLTGDEILVVPNVPFGESVYLMLLKSRNVQSILLVAEKDFPAPFLAAVNVALPSIFGSNSDLFLTASARTLLFGGVLIDCWHRGVLTSAVCNALRDRSSGLKKLGEDRYSFSYLGAKNGSVERSQYTVRRGAEVAAEVGRLVAVDGRPHLNYWRGKCNSLHGTDGSIFPPFRNPDNHSVVAYSGEVCRVIHGVYEGQHVANGVSGFAYSVTFGDTDHNPEDRCYCAAEDRCYKKGTLDAFKCQGAPLVASLPHFYQASEHYKRGVNGLSLDKDKHGILVVLEPTSGTPLIVKKRIQMNIDLKPIRFTPGTQGLRRALVPLFWAEELFELNGELLDLLETSLLRPMRVVHVGRWVLVILGASLLAFAGAIKIKHTRRDTMLDLEKNFDYGPDFKQKLKYLASGETVVKGPFFIDPRQSIPQPRWDMARGGAVAPTGTEIVKNAEATAAGATKTVKYKRISGLREITVKEQNQ